MVCSGLINSGLIRNRRDWLAWRHLARPVHVSFAWRAAILPARFGFAGSCEPEGNHAGNTTLCFAIHITCSRHVLPMLLCVLQRFQLKERTSAFAAANAGCLKRVKALFGLELLVHAQQYPRTFPSSTHHDNIKLGSKRQSIHLHL